MTLKIVLTGGPCSSKTTFLNILKKSFGSRIVAVPESATMLLAAGFPTPTDKFILKEFQSAIVHLQQSLEKTSMHLANLKKCQGLLIDRGIFDGLAYLDTTLEEFTQQHQLEEMNKCYDVVIHLPTVAKFSELLYTKLKLTNPCRMETAADAIKLDNRIGNIYSRHRNYHLITSFDETIALNAVENILNNYLSG